jgi:hypothetical protein
MQINAHEVADRCRTQSDATAPVKLHASCSFCMGESEGGAAQPLTQGGDLRSPSHIRLLRTSAGKVRSADVGSEFQLPPSKNRFLAPEKLKLSLISFTNSPASHAGNRGSKPLRGATGCDISETDGAVRCLGSAACRELLSSFGHFNSVLCCFEALFPFSP